MTCATLRPHHRPLLALGALLLLSACGQLGNVDDCNAMARSINPILAQIEELSKAPPTAASYTAIAAHYGTIEKDLAGRLHRDPALQKAVEEYRDLIATTAKNAEAYAKAIKDVDARKQNVVRTGQQQQTHRQRTALRRLGSACHGR